MKQETRAHVDASTAAKIRGWEQTLASIVAGELAPDELQAIARQLFRALGEEFVHPLSPEWNAAGGRKLLALLGKVQKALPLSAWKQPF